MFFINLLKQKNFDYKRYWQKNYFSGGNSGKGSYGILAKYKAIVINDFVKKNKIKRVIDFGCGDGNQLRYFKFEQYLGLDIAKSAVDRCIRKFSRDKSKSFMLYDPLGFKNNGYINADMVISLNVLYHIIPEKEYIKTLQDIFSSSLKWVILYTTTDKSKLGEYIPGTHIYHRDTVSYLRIIKGFKIVNIIKQKYPNQSCADFVILRKT